MKNTNPLEDLQEIRRMMEGSSKFLSLSGLSGIFAGLTALTGAWFARKEIITFRKKYVFYDLQGRLKEGFWELDKRLMLIAFLVLIVALGFGVFFTWLKARKSGSSLVTPLSFRLVRSMMVPLFFGGLFCFALYWHGFIGAISPAMLIFYGMALLNASKYVHADIKYLALCEMALGVVGMFYIYHGLIFWSIGFGVLHILYGTIMYFKYDRK